MKKKYFISYYERMIRSKDNTDFIPRNDIITQDPLTWQEEKGIRYILMWWKDISGDGS